MKFNTTGEVTILLLDRYGAKIISKNITPMEEGTYSPMSGFQTTPELGTYELKVLSTATGEMVFEKSLAFTGPDVEIASFTLDKKWDEGLEYGAITSITISTRNDGDLPTYPHHIEVAGKTDFIELIVRGLNPGEVIIPSTLSSYVGEIPAGTHEVTVEYSTYKVLYWQNGKIISRFLNCFIVRILGHRKAYREGGESPYLESSA